MLKRITITAAIVALLSIAVARFIYRPEPPALANQTQQPRVEAAQLDPVGGAIPIEITKISMAENNALGFSLRNNTTRPLDAAVVVIRGTRVAPDGKPHRDWRLDVNFDHRIHPAITALHKQQPIAPGGEIAFPAEPLELEGGYSIGAITISVDCGVFSDNSTIGPNKLGQSRIFDPRAGALKYEQWFNQQVREKAPRDILPQPLPAIFESEGEKSGARKLQRHLLRTHDHR